MTLSGFNALLLTSGFPVSCGNIPEEVEEEPPFIVYREINTDNFWADGIVYQKIHHCVVDLFTRGKDITSETALEAVLGNLYRNMTSTDEYDERITVTTYEVDFIE